MGERDRGADHDGRLLALALGAGWVESAKAQADFLRPGAGFVTAGAARIATGELDDWLSGRGYPTFGQTAVTAGLGAVGWAWRR